MTKAFDSRIGAVSSPSDAEKDQRFANNLNRFVMVLAIAVTIMLFFL